MSDDILDTMARRKRQLESLAADGDENAAHDLFTEFGDDTYADHRA